jgi:hypothetical protein
LLSFALDGKVADPVALQAIRDALDRAGMKPGIDVDVTVKPFESIFEAMEMGGSRAEFRSESVTEAIEGDDNAQHALAVNTRSGDDAIDVEIVDDAEPIPPADRLHGSQDDSQPDWPPPTPFRIGNATRSRHDAT